jgi:hypothetical protein
MGVLMCKLGKDPVDIPIGLTQAIKKTTHFMPIYSALRWLSSC